MTTRPEEQSLGEEQAAADGRRHLRAQVRCRVVWDHTGKEGTQGEILDISSAGLFLATSTELPQTLALGDVVWGQFEIKGEEFPFSAIVRWRGMNPSHKREGVGLEFTELSQIPFECLREFVAAHTSGSPKV